MVQQYWQNVAFVWWMIKQRPHIAGWEKVAVKVTTVAKDVATLVTNVLAAMHIGWQIYICKAVCTYANIYWGNGHILKVSRVENTNFLMRFQLFGCCRSQNKFGWSPYSQSFTFQTLDKEKVKEWYLIILILSSIASQLHLSQSITIIKIYICHQNPIWAKQCAEWDWFF